MRTQVPNWVAGRLDWHPEENRGRPLRLPIPDIGACTYEQKLGWAAQWHAEFVISERFGGLETTHTGEYRDHGGIDLLAWGPDGDNFGVQVKSDFTLLPNVFLEWEKNGKPSWANPDGPGGVHIVMLYYPRSHFNLIFMLNLETLRQKAAAWRRTLPVRRTDYSCGIIIEKEALAQLIPTWGNGSVAFKYPHLEDQLRDPFLRDIMAHRGIP